MYQTLSIKSKIYGEQKKKEAYTIDKEERDKNIDYIYRKKKDAYDVIKGRNYRLKITKRYCRQKKIEIL